MKRLLFCSAVLSMCSALASQAAVITFEELTPSGNLGGGAPTVPAVTDFYASEGVVFGQTGVSAGIVAATDFGLQAISGTNVAVGLDSSGDIPTSATGDIYFSFVTPGTTTPSTANNVAFWIGDSGGDVDFFQIRVFDLLDNLIETQDLSGASIFQVLLAQSDIHRVEIDFSGSFGFGLDDLEFESGGMGTVPEPSSALLLLAGVAALGLIRRRSAP